MRGAEADVCPRGTLNDTQETNRELEASRGRTGDGRSLTSGHSLLPHVWIIRDKQNGSGS